MLMLSRRSLSAALALAVSAFVLGGPAAAQKFPERPVTLIVPWAAGGGADLVSRILAAGSRRNWASPSTSSTAPAAAGVTGHTAIMTAAPDGYTLGVATSEIATFKTIGLADITPDSYDIISRIVTIPAGITVSSDGP
jgi:tripartite-type tricarboxylate transporter receptor subunit TctC